VRIAALAAALGWQATVGPARAQAPPDSSNSLIGFAYQQPKSTKYLPMLERLESFQVLEQLSQFLSPLRLPRRLALTTKECGAVNAYFIVRPDADPAWRIEICYEFIEVLERIAPRQGQASDVSYEDVVVGALVGVLLHEAGHAVFNMLNVAVLGREEDAADQMATFIALQFNKDVARTIVKGFAYLAKAYFESGAPLYFDEHGTGLQRYYNTLCLAHGGDPALFADILAKSDLPRTRAANCASEYQQVKVAFEKTVAPYIDPGLMQQVQTRPWLKLSAAQAAVLRQQQLEQQQTFTFAACNVGAVSDVYIALMVRGGDDPQKWWVHGWFPIPDKGCNYVGTFYGDSFFWYAFGGDGKNVWSAPDSDRTVSKQCIDKVKAFAEPAGTPCPRGRVIVNFRRWTVEPSMGGITLKLN
jgi:hypothetical protein